MDLFTLQERKLCLIYFLFYWVDREGGSNCNLKLWIVKWENVNENGPAGIVVRVFCPNGVQLLWTTSSQPVKGATTFGLKLALYDMARGVSNSKLDGTNCV